MPIVAFLQRSARKFGKSTPNWVRKGNIFNIKPFRSPFFGFLLGSAGKVTCSGYAPYFGAAHFKYGTSLGTRGKAEKLSPEFEVSLAA